MQRDELSSADLNISRPIANGLRAVGLVFPLTAFLIVLVALGSQLVHSPLSAQALVALRGMATLTALALSCLSLVQLAWKYLGQRTLKLGSSAALFFSVLALSSYAIDGQDNISPRIAQLLFGPSSLSDDHSSIATALCMLLLSLSQLCRLTNRTLACDFLAGTTVLIAGAALIATLFGVPDLHHIFIYSSMALPTAFAIWLLGIACVASDPFKGWAALIASNRPAGRFTRRNLLFSHVPILLVGVAIHEIRNGRISTEAALTFLVVFVMAPTIALIFKSAAGQESRDKTNEAVERFRQETASGVQTKLFEQASALRKEGEERHKAESVMYRTQRLEAIGQLTGGIAHDFNNLLMAVGTTLNLVIKQMTPGHPTRILVERAIATMDRGARLTKQLLVFSKTQMLDVRSVNINAIIDGATELIHSALGPNIQIVLDLHTEGIWVWTDPDQLQLAILNLALNARDAMPDGGTLSISTGMSASSTLNGDTQESVHVRVTDNGLGMSAEVVARAGEPFFTTKAQGEGTGLGLAQVYGVMKQSGGDLRIESEPGAGTTIDLLLVRTQPALTKSLTSPQSVIESIAKPHGAVVLLIDDDDEVRTAMAELFRLEGYDVIDANNGQAGLTLLETNQPSVAVIDYLMPGLNGVQVAQLARAKQPFLPIIFVSGYADTMALESVSGAKVLRKPVNADELLAVVSEHASL